MSWPQQAIKICGVRSVEAAVTAASAGADLIGMIFAPSKRQIDLNLAQAIAQAVRATETECQLVGVFANAPASEINEVAQAVGLDVVQLSGDEPIAISAQIQLPLLKAVRLTNQNSEQAWYDIAQGQQRIRLVVDAHVPGSYGGAGVLADWEAARRLAQTTPLLLAGGLEPTNVAQAIQAVEPWGVDVSSGIETAGIKDLNKIIQFVKTAQQALNALRVARRNA
ncbi:phosphoribosylanthranilate isomerase [Herpetosiphon llansteffanensis]|uniref:phosphoribosylanthranilate isomerase n=1 Tax=Herpetosiphon llansteffanensis TaxID=2094568 RepID=UPI000D7BE3A5|nr:phosphoribosylanthranilate isomerase [Herpetosiphon llansteffanensis]